MLKINSAFYDKLDVTDIVSKYLKNDGISINVSNDIFGDPAPNTPKRLNVKYEINGVEYTKSILENSSLDISNFIVDIIIPFKNSTKERERNLFYVIKYYKKYLPKSNIIIIEQDTKTELSELSNLVSKHLHILNTNDLFEKGYLFNQGFNISNAEYLILADADCVIDKNILINFEKYKTLFDEKYVIPYKNKVIYLDEEETIKFIDNNLENNGVNEILKEGSQYCNGGIGIINSNIYYKVGGYDERYKGWGFEDDSFCNKCIGLGVNVERIGEDLIHLYHPSAFSLGVSGYHENSLIYKTYLNKNMQDYVNELGYSHLKLNVDYSRIKIISNNFNDSLSAISESFYNKIDFEHISVKGNTGIYGLSFFEYVMKNINNCDWMIYIDEDCFITNISAMLDLLFYQIKNNIAFSGMPDGGVISHRFHNPISINAFFTIINLKMLRDIYKGEQLYSNDLDKFIPTHLIKKNVQENDKYQRTIAPGYDPYGVIYDNFEPYYSIFFTFLRNGGIPLYLDAYDSDLDDLTTILKNHNGVEFAYHTWFARDWNNNSNKQRILNVFEHCDKIKKNFIETKSQFNKKIKFIVPLPDSSYYLWQALVQVNNFRKIGYEVDTHYLVCYSNNTPSNLLSELSKSSNIKSKFHLYSDEREDKSYSASMKPWLMGQYFKEFPDEKCNIYIYLDPDVIFLNPINWNKFTDDDIWYESDTCSYLNSTYIKSKGEQLFTEMCDIAGISPEMVIDNDLNCGGAQYVTKNNTYEVWSEIEKMSVPLYKHMVDTSTKYKPEGELYPIQAWTSEMWATNWVLWKHGIKTKCHEDLEFHWANHKMDALRHNIYHNAGVTIDDGEFFAKTVYQKSPFNKEVKGKTDSISYKYIEEIKDTEVNFPELIIYFE